MKPCAASACCTAPDTADCTNAAAAAWLDDALTTAIGYTIDGCWLSGIGTPVTFEPAANTSVTYTTVASTSPLVTWVIAVLTSGSRDFGVMVIPSWASTWRV